MLGPLIQPVRSNIHRIECDSVIVKKCFCLDHVKKMLDM